MGGVEREGETYNRRLVVSGSGESSRCAGRGGTSARGTSSSVSLGHLQRSQCQYRVKEEQADERTMGLEMASSSFCFSEYSSVLASALASSHEMVSVMALSSVSLSAASSLSLRSPSTEFRRL